MHQLKVRIAEPGDTEKIVEWINSTPGNLFDPDVLKYPTLRVICAYDAEPLVYLPTQCALFLESLAVSPNAALTDRAQAFRDLVKNAEFLASLDKIKEMYMLCADEAVLKIAEGHGFTRVPYPLVRMKLK